MKHTAVTFALALSACIVGDGAEDQGDNVRAATPFYGNDLEWTGISAFCGGPNSSVVLVETIATAVPYGANLSILSNAKQPRTNCRVRGTLHVPEGLLLRNLDQIVRVSEPNARGVYYAVTFNGQRVVSSSNVTQDGTIEVRTNLTSIGRQICDRQQDVAVPFEITVQFATPFLEPTYLDAVDWMFPDAVPCPAD